MAPVLLRNSQLPGVQAVRPQGVLGDHHRRPEDAGPVAELRRYQLEVAGRQRQGALVDDGAYAGEEPFVRECRIAAYDDHAGVGEVDRGGEHLPDRPSYRDTPEIGCQDQPRVLVEDRNGRRTSPGGVPTLPPPRDHAPNDPCRKRGRDVGTKASTTTPVSPRASV